MAIESSDGNGYEHLDAVEEMNVEGAAMEPDPSA